VTKGFDPGEEPLEGDTAAPVWVALPMADARLFV